MAAGKQDTALAFVHNEKCGTNWALSILKLGLVEMGNHLRPECIYSMYATTGMINVARNMIVESFLKGPATWLFWCDTDIGFEQDTLQRLRHLADSTKSKFVGATCYITQSVQADNMGGFQITASPNIYVDDPASGKYSSAMHYLDGGVHDVEAVGSGLIMVHRGVYKQISEKFGHGSWYSELDGLTEDLSFCRRARACGVRITIDDSIRTNHLKPVWLQNTSR